MTVGCKIEIESIGQDSFHALDREVMRHAQDVPLRQRHSLAHIRSQATSSTIRDPYSPPAESHSTAENPLDQPQSAKRTTHDPEQMMITLSNRSETLPEPLPSPQQSTSNHSAFPLPAVDEQIILLSMILPSLSQQTTSNHSAINRSVSFLQQSTSNDSAIHDSAFPPQPPARTP